MDRDPEANLQPWDYIYYDPQWDAGQEQGYNVQLSAFPPIHSSQLPHFPPIINLNDVLIEEYDADH
jgi:hypothetical protein